ncbi:methyl-accepting chemotaxis protein [Ramlibacter sp.]|uniref:methyl-accepting chemotaxis protein n=1 Tax=Ramlibacter sp. TaxID=1917967 RepID=UPI0035AF079B
MKIWLKILIAPAVAIVCLLAFGALAYGVLERQAASLEELTTNRRSGVEAAMGTAQRLSATHASIYRLFTWRGTLSDESIKATAGPLTDQIDDVHGFLTGMKAQPSLAPQERALLEQALGHLGEYRNGVREAVEKSGGAATAGGLMADADNTYQATLQALNALGDLEKKLAQESYDRAAASYRQGQVLLLVILSLAVLASVGIAVAVSRAIVRPLDAAIKTAARIAEGDLTAQIRVVGSDETAELSRALLGMTQNLRELVAQVARGAHVVADTSEQIAQGNLDLSQRTEEQASTLEQTASSMEELTSTVAQNAQNARQASELAAGAADIAQKGGQVVGRVVSTMHDISAASGRIGDIIGVIDGIAFQTNILALNAAVEAARAGEQGRGFAVVAGEVRTLAQRSAAAAKEIKTLIADSVNRVETGTKMVDQAGATMREVVASVQRVSALIAEIAAASQEQSQGIGQVNTAVVHMEQVVQQNASLVEEATAATEAMKAQAQALLEQLQRFRLGDQREGEPMHAPEPVLAEIEPPMAVGHAAGQSLPWQR